MATIVASRYAVLSMDKDDDDASGLYPRKKKNKKPVAAKSQNLPIKSETNVTKKKMQEQLQPSNLKKNKTVSTSAKKKKENVKEHTTENIKNNSKSNSKEQSVQWEEWKEKDSRIIQENFEEDLSRAILLSKMDYEKKKGFYETIKKQNDTEENTNVKKSKKNKKVMSLGEFIDSEPKSDVENIKPKSAKSEKLQGKIGKESKKEILKEPLNKKVNDCNIQDSLTLVLYEASLEKKDREIVQLKAEVDRLNNQLKNVKTRNMKLCQIIANGEMKDKAEVLMEVERLQSIKDELSSEVANLHIQLEQEKSKVRQLMGDYKSKDKSKKNLHTSNQG